MLSSRSPYNQLAIGDCGHVVTTWPQVHMLGGNGARVICDDCTREAFGLHSGEDFIWVRLTERAMPSNAVEGVKISKPRKKAQPKKATPPKPKSMMARYLEQEGFI